MPLRQSKYIEFLKDFNEGKYPHARFGQAFSAMFKCRGDIDDTPLFYEEDRKQAEEMIWNYYELWDDTEYGSVNGSEEMNKG